MDRNIHRIGVGYLPAEGVLVRLTKVFPTENSFIIMCFLNLPPDKDATADEQDVHWVNSVAMYGRGARVETLSDSALIEFMIEINAEHVRGVGHHGDGEDVLTFKSVNVDGALVSEPLSYSECLLEKLTIEGT